MNTTEPTKELNAADIKFKVIAPAFRGAPAPEFVETGFNEPRIPDGMRYKSVSSHPSETDPKVLIVDWETQECYDDSGLYQFTDEARRWAEANKLAENGITAEFNLSDRYSDWTAWFTVGK